MNKTRTRRPYNLMVRMSEEEDDVIAEIQNITGMTYSNIVRTALRRYLDDLKYPKEGSTDAKQS